MFDIKKIQELIAQALPGDALYGAKIEDFIHDSYTLQLADVGRQDEALKELEKIFNLVEFEANGARIASVWRKDRGTN